MEEDEQQNEEQEEQLPHEEPFEDDYDPAELLPLKPLTQEMIGKGMSTVKKVYGKDVIILDGSSYAMTTLTLKQLDIDSTGDFLRTMINIRYLDLSENNLQDVSDLVFLP